VENRKTKKEKDGYAQKYQPGIRVVSPEKEKESYAGKDYQKKVLSPERKSHHSLTESHHEDPQSKPQTTRADEKMKCEKCYKVCAFSALTLMVGRQNHRGITARLSSRGRRVGALRVNTGTQTAIQYDTRCCFNVRSKGRHESA